MKLSEFLSKNEMTRQQFAKTIGCNAQTVWVWLQGKSAPGRYMNAIIKATDGQVTANDFYDLPPVSVQP